MPDQSGRVASPPEHHGQPMRWRGSGTRWEGEYEVNEIRYACSECGSQVTVTVHEHVGPVPS